MNIGAVIQARMGSTRLPEKILKDINGQTMLARVINRVKRAKTLDYLIVATTEDPKDDLVVEEVLKHNALIYRGSENDVLDRYYKTALEYKLDVIVRITSDCPLIEPEIIDKVVKNFIESSPPFDYASNILERTYPRGLDIEVMWLTTLTRAWEEANETYQREHVTPFIYQNPGQFRLLSIEGGKGKEFRWTVDTPEDLAFVRMVYKKLNNSDSFSWYDVLSLLDKEPHLKEINKDVIQKKLQEKSL